MFPTTRLRRLRYYSWLRDIVSENYLNIKNLIYPIFITSGKNIRHSINTLPDVEKVSVDQALVDIKLAYSLGIRAVMIFPVVAENFKTVNGEYAWCRDNLINIAVKEIKDKLPDIGIICDIALDPYTTHGHDGILVNNYVDNDLTLEALAKQSLSLAEAGVDIVSPSDMMDGRIGFIRKCLDNNQYQRVSILSYSAKYASSFYGPFRDAIGSKKNLGNMNKKTYHMDFRNKRESLREASLDVQEGADIIMIKPALPYLDIVQLVSQNFDVPVFAYQVSGEYASLKVAAEAKVLDFNSSLLESLICIKRAGALSIVTYGAIEAAKLLNE